MLELVVDTRLVGRLRGLPSRSHPITGTVVTSSSRSEALWLQRPSLTGGGLVLRSRCTWRAPRARARTGPAAQLTGFRKLRWGQN